MPKALTVDERLQRARDLLAEAAAIDVPDHGRERVGPLARKRHLLENAAHYARQIVAFTATGRPRNTISSHATAEQQAEAQRILQTIDTDWPLPQDQLEREVKKTGRPRRAGETSDVVPVRLTPEEIAFAKVAGDGSVSEGIRRGLDALRTA